ncbi:MAG: hypothetical protein UHS41_02490 [Lachnospiraceae bacterium]|nr:hypothetical protein [Lachnospiraceae bacterium]
MFDLEEDLLTIVLKTQMYQKVLTLQEETITFLGKMGKHASNEEMKAAINTVRAIYIEQQENPDAIENSIIENCSNSGSIWLKASGGKSEVLFGAGIIANVYSAGNQLIGCKNEADITVNVKTVQDHGDYTQYGKAYAGGIAADIYGETVSSCSNTGTIGCYGTVYPEDGEIGAYCIAGGIVGRKSSYGVTIADDNINSGTVEAVSGNTKKNEYVGDIFGASGQQ